jgi:hypothetical protein
MFSKWKVDKNFDVGMLQKRPILSRLPNITSAVLSCKNVQNSGKETLAMHIMLRDELTQF